MSNRDRILEYLSDVMAAGERERFDEELKSSGELRREFDMIKRTLKNVGYSSDTEVDINYFNNLIPRMRNRLNRKSKSAFSRNHKHAMALGIIVVIVSLVIFAPGNLIDSYNLPSSDQLAFAEDSVLNNYLDNSYYSNQMNTGNAEDLEGFDESGLRSDELEVYLLDNPDDLTSSINDLVDEDELLSVINELSNKKIL